MFLPSSTLSQISCLIALVLYRFCFLTQLYFSSVGVTVLKDMFCFLPYNFSADMCGPAQSGLYKPDSNTNILKLAYSFHIGVEW